MLCIIELKNYDWLEYRTETFRKLLSTVRTKNIARPKIILKLLKALIKENYDFKAVTNLQKENLNLLKKGESDYRWDPDGYEIIRFDTWWMEKLKKRHQ